MEVGAFSLWALEAVPGKGPQIKKLMAEQEMRLPSVFLGLAPSQRGSEWSHSKILG